MSKPVITVKKETLDYLQNTGIAQIMRDWRDWLNGHPYPNRKDIFNNLNSAMYDSSASDVIEFYVSDAYDFVPAEKTYQIVLPEVYRSGSGTVWSYMYMELNKDQKPKITYTDSLYQVYSFPESKLKYFPKWAQELAKEVEK